MTTTIKVSKSLRDRLRAEANRDAVTLGSLLEQLLEERARARRFDAMREAIEATSADDLASWREETEAWDVTVADGLDGV